MSDIRSMLRSERATRRITHPQAQYTSTGALVCKACRTQLKSDAHWQSHISTPQHIRVLRSLASGLMSQKPATGVKRKAQSEEGEHEESSSHKRSKPAADDTETTNLGVVPQTGPGSNSPETSVPVDSSSLDLDREYAAFERAMAESRPSGPHDHRDQEYAAATIFAAPVSAAEAAMKSSDAQTTESRALRDAEIEGEKEDAQRRLEEEFDEMEELEARVNRLKERREALRPKIPLAAANKPTTSDRRSETNHENEDDESEEDWDDWGRF